MTLLDKMRMIARAELSRGILPVSILTASNPKTDKSVPYGYLTTLLHLFPHTGSGYNVCPSASPGCSDACLAFAGRGQETMLLANGKQRVWVARLKRTLLFMEQRELFSRLLFRDMTRHIKRAEHTGIVPCVRPNGTSDLLWEQIELYDSFNGQTLLDAFPFLQFYDYTKRPRRNVPGNYDLTFSLSETNAHDAWAEYKRGTNLAVVFDSVPLTWNGQTVIDGNKSDLRFTDPRSVIVGLPTRGKRGKRDASGFVIRTQTNGTHTQCE